MITNATVKFYEKDGCLWFNLFKPSSADIVAAPFEFDGPATSDHIKSYPDAFKAFTKAKEVKKQEEIDAAISAALEKASQPSAELAEPNEETVEAV